MGESGNSLKIEVYQEEKLGVESVCKYELENTYYSTDYKSYYIDRENQFLGMGFVTESEKYQASNNYMLLLFDGYDLHTVAEVELLGQPEHMRGVYIDGYLYALGENGLQVDKVS